MGFAVAWSVVLPVVFLSPCKHITKVATIEAGQSQPLSPSRSAHGLQQRVGDVAGRAAAARGDLRRERREAPAEAREALQVLRRRAARHLHLEKGVHLE